MTVLFLLRSNLGQVIHTCVTLSQAV